MKKLVTLLSLTAYFFSCNFSYQRERAVTTHADSIQINIFRVNEGYGYEIYLHDKKVIYQPTIPAVEGTVNFPTADFASETAHLVSSKIRAGIIPPSISSEEMDVLFKRHNQ